MNKKRILLLSAYHADSHRYWCEGLCRELPIYEWVCLTLPARHFSWRIRGNALSWAYGASDQLNQHYDLIIATSMVDLSTLKGLIPGLAAVPAILYFHENQFAYPTSAKQLGSAEPRITSIYSALSAQVLVFNSTYNQETFLSGVLNFLKKMPDQVPSNIVTQLKNKCRALPVPLAGANCNVPADSVASIKKNEPVNIVWNHRWEYDKGPDRLLALIDQLAQNIGHSVRLCFHIVGQQFRHQPKEFSTIQQRLQQMGWLGRWGYIDNQQDYQRLLDSSDIVLSTAVHDFQGLSVMEGVARGCAPLLPNRMAYPNFFLEDYLYESSDDIQLEAKSACKSLLEMIDRESLPVPDMEIYSWSCLVKQYRDLIDVYMKV